MFYAPSTMVTNISKPSRVPGELYLYYSELYPIYLVYMYILCIACRYLVCRGCFDVALKIDASVEVKRTGGFALEHSALQ